MSIASKSLLHDEFFRLWIAAPEARCLHAALNSASCTHRRTLYAADGKEALSAQDRLIHVVQPPERR